MAPRARACRSSLAVLGTVPIAIGYGESQVGGGDTHAGGGGGDTHVGGGDTELARSRFREGGRASLHFSSWPFAGQICEAGVQGVLDGRLGIRSPTCGSALVCMSLLCSSGRDLRRLGGRLDLLRQTNADWLLGLGGGVSNGTLNSDGSAVALLLHRLSNACLSSSGGNGRRHGRRCALPWQCGDAIRPM